MLWEIWAGCRRHLQEWGTLEARTAQTGSGASGKSQALPFPALLRFSSVPSGSSVTCLPWQGRTGPRFLASASDHQQSQPDQQPLALPSPLLWPTCAGIPSDVTRKAARGSSPEPAWGIMNEDRDRARTLLLTRRPRSPAGPAAVLLQAAHVGSLPGA